MARDRQFSVVSTVSLVVRQLESYMRLPYGERSAGMRLKDQIRLVTPPLFVELAVRLRTRRKLPIEWEYVPEGWAYGQTHPEVGLERSGCAGNLSQKWPQFVRMVQGTGPLGIARDLP